ncbi:transposase [Sphaerisporangium siamense]|uniref:Transposase n=1 Tax=Sphaerisporangium siamense TaxID=795645 RepID=A0A7W7D6T3_9ACTN|nr:RNA-guided endonuclease TnpB family protein [Sphaerisporangium siamense]MBB4701354.1 transposase [Sphaerisporangium siamense]GII87277.1 transposase [Sphaerisporangium siamense]
MLTGRRYLLAFTPEQEEFSEKIGDACRAVWNTALEQRREYRRRGVWINYVEQARQMAEAKRDFPWLAEAPSHTLQQTLRDLERACETHGTFKVRWRSKRKSPPSFRFPDPKHISVERVSRRWGRVRLPKLGWVRFRWTRPLAGELRNATVLTDGGRWFISFCVEDGLVESAPNGKPAVGVDRGVRIAVAASDGWTRDREFVTPGEAARLKRLQRNLDRQRKGSNRRAATRKKIGKLNARIRSRRTDFTAWTANRLTRDHGVVVVEDLRVRNMTASPKGSVEAPGKNVRQKAALNRAILAKGWGGLLSTLEHKARYNGSRVVRMPAAHTSQRCSACGTVDAKSRESQAVFACTSCAYTANADVNAAKNILGAGLALTGHGDLGVARSVKCQPPKSEAA